MCVRRECARLDQLVPFQLFGRKNIHWPLAEASWNGINHNKLERHYGTQVCQRSLSRTASFTSENVSVIVVYTVLKKLGVGLRRGFGARATPSRLAASGPMSESGNWERTRSKMGVAAPFCSSSQSDSPR